MPLSLRPCLHFFSSETSVAVRKSNGLKTCLAISDLSIWKLCQKAMASGLSRIQIRMDSLWINQYQSVSIGISRYQSVPNSNGGIGMASSNRVLEIKCELHSLPKLPKSRDSPKRDSSTIVLDLVGQGAFNLRALCLAKFGGLRANNFQKLQVFAEANPKLQHFPRRPRRPRRTQADPGGPCSWRSPQRRSRQT